MRPGLRSQRTYAKRYSPIRRRSAVVLALAMAGVLAVAGIALGSTASFSFSPNTGVGNVYKSGKFSLHAQMSSYTNRLRFRFDDDFQFNPNAIPYCDRSRLTGNQTMRSALARCGPAWLWPANSGTSNGTAKVSSLNACVLVLNGRAPTTSAELLLFMRIETTNQQPIDCSDPVHNDAGDVSRVLRVFLKANPAIGPDYTDPDGCSGPDPRRGCQIDIDQIAQQLQPSPSPFWTLLDLNIRIQRGIYVRARCVDPPAGNRRWNLQTVFTGAATQTVNKSQGCT